MRTSLPGVYTIGHAAQLTGVPAATLRVWERRYGLVRPERSEGGYRLYDEHALQVLRAMSALVAAGWSPRTAAAHLLAGAEAPDGPRPAAPAAPPAGSASWDTTALAQGAVDLDREAVSAALDTAFAATDLEQVLDEWLMPSLEAVGSWWRDGLVDVAGEHVVSAAVERRLGATLDAVSVPARGPLVAVGLARGSLHELGVLAFAVALRRLGVDVVYLGADLPPQSWVSMIRARPPAAVVIGAPMVTDVIAIRETVDALRAARPQLPVFVGGSAQDEVGHGTRALGHTMRRASRTLVDALGAGTARAPA
jgi:methanogenic corrinoid protein MtbC1